MRSIDGRRRRVATGRCRGSRRGSAARGRRLLGSSTPIGTVAHHRLRTISFSATTVPYRCADRCHRATMNGRGGASHTQRISIAGGHHALDCPRCILGLGGLAASAAVAHGQSHPGNVLAGSFTPPSSSKLLAAGTAGVPPLVTLAGAASVRWPERQSLDALHHPVRARPRRCHRQRRAIDLATGHRVNRPTATRDGPPAGGQLPTARITSPPAATSPAPGVCQRHAGARNLNQPPTTEFSSPRSPAAGSSTSRPGGTSAPTPASPSACRAQSTSSRTPPGRSSSARRARRR